MTTKMNPEVKAKWLAALRSNEYEQGTGALCQDGRMCCLGVLSDIHAKETGEGKWIQGYSEGRPALYTVAGGGEEEGILLDDVSDWAGLPSNNPVIGYDADGRSASVAELNDKGRTFAQLADIIEAQL
jgi:hypothetical protein